MIINNNTPPVAAPIIKCGDDVLLASADGITSELLDAGVTLANVDVEEDASEGDAVDCWMGDKGDDWLMDTGEGISVGDVMIVG